MKIIISHDVDHITALEHKKDLIIPKQIIRSLIELGSGYISASETKGRLQSIIQNKLQNLKELLNFDKEFGIPSTFFVAVANGKGLSYSLENAEFWIKTITTEGFDVGVHGIAFDGYDRIKHEFDTFKQIAGLSQFGIRMHYLRRTPKTLNLLSDAGYVYDSTINELRNPYKIDAMWEIPLHLMDVHIFARNARWQNQDLEQAIGATKKRLEKAYDDGVKFFTILFHDNVFNDGFRTRKNWYIWLVNYLRDNELKFINYRQAMEELEKL